MFLSVSLSLSLSSSYFQIRRKLPLPLQIDTYLPPALFPILMVVNLAPETISKAQVRSILFLLSSKLVIFYYDGKDIS